MRTLLRFKWVVLLGLLGAGVLAWTMVAFFGDLFGDPDATFTVPGEATVKVAAPGDYIVWHESTTTVGGLPAGATFTVRKMPEGTDVPTSAAGHQTWTVNGTRRESVVRFTAAGPGDYRVSVAGLSGRQVFSVSRDWLAGTVLRFFVGVFLGATLEAVAVIVGIVVLIRLLTERKAARANF